MTSTLRVQDVRKRYRRDFVLAGISFDLDPGITVLLGPNGAGKSTLIRIMVGFESPSSGTVEQVDVESEGDLSGRLGWLPQSFGFPPRMRTDEFVTYAAWLKKSDASARAVGAALRACDVEAVANEQLGRLSLGTLRRVGLAASIVSNPEILILDEPTAGLDPMQRDSFHSTMRRLSEDTTVLLATHLLEDAQALADRLIVMDHGEIKWQGSVPQLERIGLPNTDTTQRLRSGLHAILAATE